MIPDEKEQEDESSPLWGLLWLILAIAGLSLLALAILAAPFVVIAAMKAARRRRRLTAPLPADRIAGGWEELMDRATDYGVRAPAGFTRQEEAVLVGGRMDESRMTTLAVRADASVFGPGEPPQVEIDDYWKNVDEVVDSMGEKASFWKRLKARVSVVSLAQSSTLSKRMRALRERIAATRKER